MIFSDTNRPHRLGDYPHHLRSKAYEARQRSERAREAEMRDVWLHIADSYEFLASYIERLREPAPLI
jgi:hypothetical protein